MTKVVEHFLGGLLHPLSQTRIIGHAPPQNLPFSATRIALTVGSGGVYVKYSIWINSILKIQVLSATTYTRQEISYIFMFDVFSSI